MKRQIIIIMFLSWAIIAYPQLNNPKGDGQQITPPSPTAASLGEYGRIPVGLYTGTPNITIPVYDFKTDNLTIPVSLGYNSNGVKVDQIASWVGMGWSLNSGGVVTRIIRDETDENHTWFRPDILDINAAENNDFFLNLMDYQVDQTDQQPDLFSFNFLGYSGTFVIDEQHNGVLLDQQNLQIKLLDASGYSKIEIITPNGVKCIFADREFTVSMNLDEGFSTGYPPSLNSDGVTSWYLTTIEHPQGDIINFEYKSHNFDYIVGMSEVSAIDQGPIGLTNGDCDCPEKSALKYIKQAVQGKVLKKISSNYGNTTINFFSSLSRNDINDYRLDSIYCMDRSELKLQNKFVFKYQDSYSSKYENVQLSNSMQRYRMFLKSFSDIKNEPYVFSYYDINSLPTRLSFAQDHWGYFNAKNNSHFAGSNVNKETDITCLKYGILKKIEYPTGGFNEFLWEPNSYRKQLGDSQLIQWEGEFSLTQGPLIDSVFFNVPFDQTISIDYEVVNLNTNSPFIPECKLELCGNGKSFFTREFRDEGSYYMKQNVDNVTDYVLKIKLLQPYTKLKLNISYYDSPYELKAVGGLRIREIKSNEEEINSKTIYYYNNFKNKESSYGQLVSLPHYNETLTYGFCCFSSPGPIPTLPVPYTCAYDLIHSSSLFQLYLGGHHIYYKCITECYGDNFEFGGKESYYFGTSDGYGGPVHGEIRSYKLYNNYGISKHYINREEFFRVNENLKVITKEINYDYCSRSYDYLRFIGYDITCRDELNCYNILNKDLFDIYRFIITPRFHYLSNKTETIYNTNGGNPITNSVEHFYDDYFQVYKTKSIKSLNETLVSKYYYPYNYSRLNNIIDTLMDKNITGVPLKTETIINKRIVDSKVTNYNKNGQPISMYSFEADSNLNLASHNPDIIIPENHYRKLKLSYDNPHNRISEKKDLNGIVTSYIWSYNYQYPIMIVENAAYDVVESVLADFHNENGVSIEDIIHQISDIITNTDDQNMWLAFCEAIRNDESLSNSYVTFYTYDPLIGMTSQTDPNGIITYYEYDDFGRLKYVKDHEGNILRKYDYHYKD
ncbi:MAG: hypothetical protein N4A74_03765 [Carboxylicivirga sp.]|jgi:YD repeat-containing protein|nr:hypothetical protein [Carboxylicivirga sp.]